MPRKINFGRDGLTLVGHLFTPENFDENGHYPAVIVEGSFTSVKEQMPSTYAQKLADEGFVALAFDYSHYGESEGEPRQLESPAEKLSDLQAAVSHLTGLPYVQAVGMVGVCTSAGNAAYLGAADPRVKALATVAAFLPGPALYATMYGEAGVAQRKQLSADARRKYEETGELTLVPAYSETDQSAINYGPAGSYDYYLNESRGNVPEYRNESALMGLEQFLEFNPSARPRPSPRRRWSSTPTSPPSRRRPRSSTRSFEARGARVGRRQPLRLLRHAGADPQRRRERDPVLPHAPRRTTGRLTLPRADPR